MTRRNRRNIRRLLRGLRDTMWPGGRSDVKVYDGLDLSAYPGLDGAPEESPRLVVLDGETSVGDVAGEAHAVGWAETEADR